MTPHETPHGRVNPSRLTDPSRPSTEAATPQVIGVTAPLTALTQPPLTFLPLSKEGQNVTPQCASAPSAPPVRQRSEERAVRRGALKR